jgi:chromosome segregation ATPase
MNNTDINDFNESILKAFANKAQRFEEKASKLEQKLKVKEAELEYLVKLYDKEKNLLSLDLENAEKKMTLLEANKGDLQNKISLKEKDIIELKTKIDSMTKEIASKEEQIQDLKSKLDVQINQLSLKIEKIEKYESKIDNLSNNIIDLNGKISEYDATIKELTDDIYKKEEIIKVQNEQIDILKIELSEFKPTKVPEINGDRLVCTKCNAVGKDIKTVEDKTKPLSYIGNIPMYAKIHVCKKCGHKF